MLTPSIFLYISLFGILNEISVVNINNSFRKLFSEKCLGVEIESSLNTLSINIISVISCTGTFVNKFSYVS